MDCSNSLMSVDYRTAILPWALTSRERTRSLLLPTRMMGVWGWVSLRRSRSWAVRWKLLRSVTENTRTHTSHWRPDRSWGSGGETHGAKLLSCTRYARQCSAGENLRRWRRVGGSWAVLWDLRISHTWFTSYRVTIVCIIAQCTCMCGRTWNTHTHTHYVFS